MFYLLISRNITIATRKRDIYIYIFTYVYTYVTIYIYTGHNNKNTVITRILVNKPSTQCTSIKGLSALIWWYLGFIRGQLGGLGMYFHGARKPVAKTTGFGVGAQLLGGAVWIAVKDLSIPRNSRFPLKGSLRGDVDIAIESYHNMDIY